MNYVSPFRSIMSQILRKVALFVSIFTTFIHVLFDPPAIIDHKQNRWKHANSEKFVGPK